MWFKDKLINFAHQLSADEHFIISDLLPETLLTQIEHLFLNRTESFKPAQIGKGLSKKQSTQIRNDHIYWLSTEELLQLSFLPFFEAIQKLLRQELFLPIKRFESHLSQYKPGDFYGKHRDQHKNAPHRHITSVFYLNSIEKKDGGQLVIYPENKDKIVIQPVKNSIVLFLSHLEHEVLPTQTSRHSLTTWFRDDIL